MKDEIKKAIEITVEKKVEWLHKRAEKAMTLGTPIWLNKTTAMVPTANEDEEHFYKVNVTPGHEHCGCKDWKYRGSVNGIPCKHLMRAMAERMVKDQEAQAEKHTAEIMAEADQAVENGELPAHIPEHHEINY